MHITPHHSSIFAPHTKYHLQPPISSRRLLYLHSIAPSIPFRSFPFVICQSMCRYDPDSVSSISLLLCQIASRCGFMSMTLSSPPIYRHLTTPLISIPRCLSFLLKTRDVQMQVPSFSICTSMKGRLDVNDSSRSSKDSIRFNTPPFPPCSRRSQAHSIFLSVIVQSRD